MPNCLSRHVERSTFPQHTRLTASCTLPRIQHCSSESPTTFTRAPVWPSPPCNRPFLPHERVASSSCRLLLADKWRHACRGRLGAAAPERGPALARGQVRGGDARTSSTLLLSPSQTGCLDFTAAFMPLPSRWHGRLPCPKSQCGNQVGEIEAYDHKEAKEDDPRFPHIYGPVRDPKVHGPHFSAFLHRLHISPLL